MSIIKNRLGNFLVNVTVLLASFFALAVAVAIMQPAIAGIIWAPKGQIAFPASGIVIAGTTMTATGPQLNFLSGVTAGTSAASKAVVLSATSKIDTIDMTAWKIGGIAVSSTAAQLDFVNVTAGALTASKAMVADSSSQFDIIDLTGSLKFAGDIALKCVTKSLTNGEVLALNGTPIELVAAPGANKVLVPYSIMAVYNYSTTAFTDDAGEDLAFKYTNAGGVEMMPRVDSDGFSDQTEDEVRIVYATDTALAGAVSSGVIPVSNAAIVVHLLVGEWIDGAGILAFRICYSVQPDLL